MSQTKIEYDEIPEFKKDLKKLSKRFRSLPEDLEVVKRNVIELFHLQRVDNQGTFPMPGFVTEDIMVCKIKKFACKTLKGKGNKSGIRVIYAFHPKTMHVDFIEIYFKQDQVNENRDRIKKYLHP